MASHESFHTSTNPTASPLPAQPHTPSNSTIPAAATGPPPPPPPKPNNPSRTSTPAVPPLPPHPNAAQNQSSARSSPTPYQQPQSPSPYPHHQGPTAQPFPTSQGRAQTAIPVPPVDSGWLPEGLKDHSTTDLQPLISNAEQIDALAKQHPAYNASLEPLQAAVSANLAMAQHVSQLEAQVKQLRDQTGQLLLNHTSLQTQWRRKQSEMDNALSPWGPRAMYSRLVSSINEQEAILRAVHESFVEGGGDASHSSQGDSGKATEKEVTEWIKRIREGATTLEKRREMRQRWDEGRVGGWR